MTSIYDYSECDEVADSIMTMLVANGGSPFKTFDEALRYVRTVMPDESETVICNVAEGLTPPKASRWPTPKDQIEGWGEW